jgi:hypothetical protein
MDVEVKLRKFFAECMAPMSDRIDKLTNDVALVKQLQHGHSTQL